jgi:predicted permease
MPRWLRRLRARWRYRRFDDDLRQELELHREMAHEDLVARGATPEKARFRAARLVGNVALTRELARGVWIPLWLESIWQDARYALRSLRKSPGYTAAVVATLTISVGLTTNFFSLVNGVLFKPWPVRDPGRVILVEPTRHFPNFIAGGMFLADFQYLRRHVRSADLAAVTVDQALIGSQPGQSIRLVSGNYFRVLGLRIVSGRPLTDEDDGVASSPSVVISHELWRDHFGGQSILGTALEINEFSFTVVGIAEPGATDNPVHPKPRAWLSLSEAERLDPSTPTDVVPRTVGMVALSVRLPPVQVKNGAITTTVAVTGTELATQSGARRGARALATLAIIPVLVFVLGCANVGNLQLARGMSRAREIAARMALGASRSRVMGQLLVEGFVLILIAGLPSLFVAFVLPRTVLVWFEPTLGAAGFDLRPDLTVVGVAAALAMITCLLAGVPPALRVTRMSPGSRHVGIDRAGLRNLLLTVQTGVTVVLLLGAGLLLRGIQHATGAGLGVTPYGTTVVTVDLPEGYEAARRRTFASNLLDSLEAAGIRPIGATAVVPYGARRSRELKARDGRALGDAVGHSVSPGYFEILEIPLRSGRLLTPSDGIEVVVINESLASRLSSDGAAVGRSFLANDVEKRVVGVVADVQSELPDRIEPTFYEPPVTFRNLIVPDDPATLARVKDLVFLLEPRANVGTASIAANLLDQLRPSIVITTVTAWISVIALLVATIGTFGVFSYVVGERTREIGVRRALGATGGDLVSWLSSRLCRPLVIGLALGLLAAQPLGGLVRNQIFGVGLHDPWAYSAVPGVVLLSAVIALIGPLWRALLVDPAITLRHE